MGENELVNGTARIGWFIDGDADTPEIAAVLEDTGEQIRLTLPTKGIFARDDPYARWFSASVLYGDDPDRSKYRYKPPRVAMMYDKDGSVVLVGCRAAGHTGTPSAGAGIIVVNFAVLGGRNLKYDKVNGMRAEIPALARWSGFWSVRKEHEADDEGRVRKVVVTLDAAQEVQLAKPLNMTMRPTWRTSYPDNIGTFATHDIVELQTTSKTPRPWVDHLRLHDAVRELLVLSAWQRLGYQRIEVSRDDDSERYPGRAPTPRWSPVATHRLRRHEPWSQEPRFFFSFSDIGAQGVRRWLGIRQHFARAIEPIIGVGDRVNSFLETNMLQVGIALEALGYQIEMDNGGANLDARGQLPFRAALKAILDDAVHVPLADPADWMERVRDCYMGVKHADNRMPDTLVVANTMRESLLVVRSWLAGRLGCSGTLVAARAEHDPLNTEYVLAD